MNHLDLDLMDGTSRIALELPHTLGLEGVGRIHAIGDGVREWSIGDRVMVLEEIPCGRCDECMAGDQNRCDEGAWIGVSRPGCYAISCRPGPRNASLCRASVRRWNGLRCRAAFGTAWHMLITRGQLHAGETGARQRRRERYRSAAVQVARLAGARVIATAGSSSKLEQALEMALTRRSTTPHRVGVKRS